MQLRAGRLKDTFVLIPWNQIIVDGLKILHGLLYHGRYIILTTFTYAWSSTVLPFLIRSVALFVAPNPNITPRHSLRSSSCALPYHTTTRLPALSILPTCPKRCKVVYIDEVLGPISMIEWMRYAGLLVLYSGWRGGRSKAIVSVSMLL